MYRLANHLPDIGEAVHFDIQNIANYYFKTKHESDWKTAQFNPRPPFDFMATQWQFPTWYGDSVFSGIEIFSVFRKTNVVPKEHIHVVSEDGDVADCKPFRPGDAVAMYNVDFFSFDKKHFLGQTKFFFAVNEHGLLCRLKDSLALWFTDGWGASQQVIFPNTLFQVSFLALTFLHCKNVEIVRPRKSRKQLPRRQKFHVNYHKIMIHSGMKKYRTESSQTEIGRKQSFHVCAGHFRHYGRASVTGHPAGKDTGLLFGRIEGKFWVDEQERGDTSVGITISDYVVG